VRAAVVGVAGPELLGAERRLLESANPLGLILFRRNCRDRAQLRALVADLRAAVGRPDAPVLIDQEGGRVVRMGPPEWRRPPAARRIGELAERDREAGLEAAWLNARLIADDLHEVGIDVDLAPVLDLPAEGGHDVIGDRAFAADPGLAGELGRRAIEGFLAGGVLPAIKHLPGHGRARADSHLELPVVDAPEEALAGRDFRPFAACCGAAPLAVTAHVVYPALDPDAPATLSPRVIEGVIRGRIGFEGALLTDDLSMGALSGPVGERARRALAAGCDLALHCNGQYAEMAEVLEATPPLAGAPARRVSEALARRHRPAPFDRAAAEARLDHLLAWGAPVA
jgi:beta-N-acetylhexosaminidase